MISDDDIRAAFGRVVSRAPSPAGIQTRLAARTRVHRQRRVLLATAGAVGVVTAVGAPGALLWRARTGYLPFLGPGPDDVTAEPDIRTVPNRPATPVEPPPGLGNIRVALRYGPTWMPDGYVEAIREVSSGGLIYQAREWQPPDMAWNRPVSVRVMLASEELFPIGNWRRPVTVNGKPAGLSPKIGQLPQIMWSVGDGLNLSVMVLGPDDGSSTAQRVARSIMAETVAGVETPVQFGWLPDALHGGATRVTLTRDGDTWVATVAIVVNSQQPLTVSLGPAVQPVLPGAETAQLRGRPGTLAMTSDGIGAAFLELDQGLRLVVTANPALAAGAPSPASPGAPIPGQPVALLSRDDLIRVVDELTVGPAPYVGWLARR